MSSQLRRALDRLGRGLLGAWCVMAPFILFSWKDAGAWIYFILTGIVIAFYVIGFWKWQQQGNSFIRAVTIDTLAAFLFASLGGFIGGFVTAFGGPSISGAATLLFVLCGFWFLEGRKKLKTVIPGHAAGPLDVPT